MWGSSVKILHLFIIICSFPFASVTAFSSKSTIIQVRATGLGKSKRFHLPTAVFYERIKSTEDDCGGANNSKGSKFDTDRRDKRTYLSQLSTRFLTKFWHVLTIPYSDLRKIIRERDRDSKDIFISLRLQEGLIVLLAYLSIGVLAYHYIFEKWSIVDSLYFSCVCFSTVGYGDLSPKTWGGKIFTFFFGFTGIALLSATIATIGSKLVEAELETIKMAQKESRKRLLQAYERMSKVITSSRRAVKPQIVKKEVRTEDQTTPSLTYEAAIAIWKVFRWICQSLLVVGVGGLVIGRIEGWNLSDSLYYGLITASTIGLGDFAPSTRAGRIVSVFFIPLAVAAAGNILAKIGLKLIERRQKKIFDNKLSMGLTMDHLETMDHDHDGKVQRDEYILFMLMEMGLVSKEEVEDLRNQFDRLDVNNHGYLDKDDLCLMAQLRGDEIDQCSF